MGTKVKLKTASPTSSVYLPMIEKGSSSELTNDGYRDGRPFEVSIKYHD